MDNVGRKITIAAAHGFVVEEAVSKRGSTLLMCKMDDGSEIKTDIRRVEFRDESMFAEPVPFAELVKDYRRDNARRRALMGI